MNAKEKTTYTATLRAAVGAYMKTGDTVIDFTDYSDIDCLAMEINDALGFSIDYTTQGTSGEPYMESSYYSPIIGHRISLGEFSNIETLEAFITECTQIKAEADKIDAKFRTLLAPRTIVVEVSGGVVNEVHGLRKGDNWDLADWDDADAAEDRGAARRHNEKIIKAAQSQ